MSQCECDEEFGRCGSSLGGDRYPATVYQDVRAQVYRRRDLWCRFSGGPRGWWVSIGRDGNMLADRFASAAEAAAYARFLARVTA